jgi:hypothetical protein
MNAIELSNKANFINIPESETQNGIDNHLKAACHFEAAARSHKEAAINHSNGYHGKAAKWAIEAYGHSSFADQAQKLEIKQHLFKG